MKQIRSGQSFLYRTNGYDSTVVEIRMRDKVTGSYLQVALTNTARRFPYLTQKLVEKGGAYYLHRDDNSMVAVKTDKFRTLGSMATGYHLLDVTYTGNCIRVAFHHGLCDGRGVSPPIPLWNSASKSATLSSCGNNMTWRRRPCGWSACAASLSASC